MQPAVLSVTQSHTPAAHPRVPGTGTRKASPGDALHRPCLSLPDLLVGTNWSP